MAYDVNERTSAVYTATLRDAAGEPVPASVITTLRGWVRDVASGTYLIEAVDLLNENGGSVHATSGLFTWAFAPADNRILGSDSTELHEAVYEATWDSGDQGATHQFEVRVVGLVPLPAAAP